MSTIAFVVSILGLCVAWEEIQVVQPVSLSSQYPNGVDHRPAMFGVPSYTTSITGNVIYATEGDLDGCDPLDNTNWPFGVPFIVMVDRGNCSFVTKVRNVQNVMGTAVVIVDNVEEAVEPFMADDNSGSDINIPSVLISLDDGQNIKDTISSEGFVTLQITWGLPHPDGRVEWTLWTSANDPASREMKQSWEPVVESLGLAAQFSPHYIIMPGESSGCDTDGLPCGNQCIMEGRYCAVDPDHDFDEGVSGADIVHENLRQICLFRELNTTTAGEEVRFQQTLKWWSYASQFIDDCCAPEDHVTGVCTNGAQWETCSRNLMQQLGVDMAAIDSCVANDAEQVLDNEIALQAQSGIIFLPTIVVNNAPYRGSLTCSEPIHTLSCGPLEAICVGYASGTEPPTCTGDMGCAFGEFYDCANVCAGDSVIDICGACVSPDSPDFDMSCAGCDGVPHSGMHNDACGVCGGDGSFDSCGRCWPANDERRIDNATQCLNSLSGISGDSVFTNVNMTMAAAVIAGVALIVIIIACVWAKRQQDQVTAINAVLASYMPLQDANQAAHGQKENAGPSDSENAIMLSGQA